MKKFAIAAALVLGTASFAVAQEARLPNEQLYPQQAGHFVKVYEGRNTAVATPAKSWSFEKAQFDRASSSRASVGR